MNEYKNISLCHIYDTQEYIWVIPRAFIFKLWDFCQSDKWQMVFQYNFKSLIMSGHPFIGSKAVCLSFFGKLSVHFLCPFIRFWVFLFSILKDFYMEKITNCLWYKLQIFFQGFFFFLLLVVHFVVFKQKSFLSYSWIYGSFLICHNPVSK